MSHPEGFLEGAWGPLCQGTQAKAWLSGKLGFGYVRECWGSGVWWGLLVGVPEIAGEDSSSLHDPCQANFVIIGPICRRGN